MNDAKSILWKDIKQKVESEWIIYTKYGKDFDSSRSSFAFAKHLNENIIDQIGTHQGTVSDHTLHRYLKDNGFPQKVSEKVLDAFAVYLGYESFRHFENTDVHIKEVLSSSKQSSSFRLKMMLGAIAISVLGALIYWTQSNKKVRDELYHLIDMANKSEFDAYRTLSDTSEYHLSKYFLKSGTALGQIKGVVDRSRNHRRKLLVPPSSYTLLHFEVLKRKKETITVLTEESWLLRWYDDSLKREILYDVSNEHVYFIKKEKNTWKIAADVYAGSARVPATEKLKN